MPGGNRSRWYTLAHVLRVEWALLRPAWFSRPDESDEEKLDAELAEPQRFDPRPLAELYEQIGEHHATDLGKKQPLSALCFSGGGIRSATFNLGVLQALARIGLLDRFDYLSSVSGGGYISAWLQGWIHRTAKDRNLSRGAALEAVVAELKGPRTGPERDPLAPEPKPIDRLREFSHYLTPRTGFFSADLWTVVAIVLRNLLLNWLVILPLFAAAVMVPQLVLLLALLRPPSSVGEWLLGAAFVFGLLSSGWIHALRLEKRGRPEPREDAERKKARRATRWRVAGTVGLLSLALGLFALGAAWSGGMLFAQPNTFAHRLLLALPWTIVIPLAGRLVLGPAAFALLRRWSGLQLGEPDDTGEQRAILGADLLALAVAGSAAAGGLAWFTGAPLLSLISNPRLFTVVAFPALLTLYVLARMLFVGVASVGDALGAEEATGDDSDREWWARLTGRLLLVAFAWAAASGLVLFGSRMISEAYAIAGGLGLSLATLVAWLGKSAQTSSGRGSESGTLLKREHLLRLAAAALIGVAIVLLAGATAALGRALISPDLLDSPSTLRDLGLFTLVALAFVALSWASGWAINVNRFSLHRLYRNRLARAYLGASNPKRRPNPTTGFDREDVKLRLAHLAENAPAPVRLLPLYNATLNLLAGDRLAWQERLAESFSMSPFFCGNFYEGYRKTSEYGAHPNGITLSNAMAVSGAAANPNMGYVSSPLLTFVLGMLNARLGVWLPNPNQNGEKFLDRSGPRHATRHLLGELFGTTNRYAPFVNLSDGGHFENLGLYEVVLRRCRFVMVSDAAHDPEGGMSDLGNAIRKIRIDFGIPIEFAQGVRIPPLAKDGTPQAAGLYCAVGTIHYEKVDGADAPPGRIIYLKPTLAPAKEGAIPSDVLAYAKSAKGFPHESTADQWFSEAQFESYRELGAHLLTVLATGDTSASPVADWDALLANVERHLQKNGGVAHAA